MFCYEIDGLKITALNQDEAENISRAIGNSEANRIIFIYEDGTVQPISLKEKDCVVFSQSGKTVKRVGELSLGRGQQMMKAAVENIDNDTKYRSKIRKHTKVRKMLAVKGKYDNIVKEFESKIPEKAQVMFLDVILQIAGNNLEYRAEMYQEIDNAIDMIHENWFRILPWYRDNVLCGGGTQFLKRKAFVTTVCRMGGEEYKIGRPIEKAVENDQDYWDRYIEKRTPGSTGDSQ